MSSSSTRNILANLNNSVSSISEDEIYLSKSPKNSQIDIN